MSLFLFFESCANLEWLLDRESGEDCEEGRRDS